MMFQTWGEVFAISLQNVWLSFSDFFFLRLIPAVIVFVLGWIIGSIIETAIKEIFKAVRLESLAEKAGLKEALKKADWHFSVGGVVGAILKWLLIIAVFGACLNMLGFVQAGALFTTFIFGYLPNVFIAVFILVVTAYVSHLIGNFVSGGAKLMEMRNGHMIASLARYAIWVFAFILAFDRLDILPGFSSILFTGFVSMIAIACGIAFGLGGKDAASRIIESIGHDMKGTQK